MNEAWETWWSRPLKLFNRVVAVLLGAFGCFWIALIGSLVFISGPVDVLVLGYWAVGGAIVGAIFGLLFPRVILVVLYPIAAITTGVGN